MQELLAKDPTQSVWMAQGSLLMNCLSSVEKQMKINEG